MDINESKQTILSLVEDGSLEPAVQGPLLSTVRQAETASELAAALVDFLAPLVTAYGATLTRVLGATLTPERWQEHGVLFNPARIPEGGPACYVALCDGSVLTQQSVAKEVIYYGDVWLSADSGVAHVVDSKNDVRFSQRATGMVGGQTRCKVFNQANVTLLDSARGEGFNQSVLYAKDKSFVDVGRDQVTLYAQDQAQFIATAGNPTIHMAGDARGFVVTDGLGQGPVIASLRGQGLLYLKGTDPEQLADLQQGFDGNILTDGGKESVEGFLLDLVVPRLHSASGVERRLLAPLDLDQLKADLKPLLTEPEWAVVREADNERELCRWMAPRLQELVPKGLDGDFLRSHFTEEALIANHIHAFSNAGWAPDPEEPGIHHFFGEQLVRADQYSQMVMGYEQALVLATDPQQYVFLLQEASGIVLGNGHLQATGSGRVLALDNGSIRVDDSVTAKLYDSSSGWAFGRSRIVGHDQSGVVALQEASVVLHDQGRADVYDHVKVLVHSKNKIQARGNAAIGWIPATGSKPLLTVQDETVQLVRLRSDREAVQFIGSIAGNYIGEWTNGRGR